VGLIAGNRSLPLIAARAVRAAGGSLATVALIGEAAPGLKKLSDHYLPLNLGQLDPLAKFFLDLGVKEVAMAGGISRESVLESYDPDEAAIRLMETLPNFQTDTILRGLAGFLEERGLKLVSVTDLAPGLLVTPGTLGSIEPKGALLADLILAFTIARELGRLDVGQTVVVSDLIAVALEGADGTDATIRRGAKISKNPIAVAKVLKPTQDVRFDLPVIGPPTLRLLAEKKAGGLALDARGLIILDPDTCRKIADGHGIALVAWLDPPAAPRGQHGE
jgi:DUF1009 family protein